MLKRDSRAQLCYLRIYDEFGRVVCYAYVRTRKQVNEWLQRERKNGAWAVLQNDHSKAIVGAAVKTGIGWNLKISLI